uniref:Inositol-polyphosphate 5-phosphatase n=1 Tax=Panagrolaimus sp. ES5 TaxID=591445 RepID=A0AC34F7B1_9BILA
MPDILLITANVGSLFDETIKEKCAKFIVLNFQETGGKEFKKYSKDVSGVINDLFNSLTDYPIVRAFLDLDFETVEEYTALGTVIFIHKDWKSNVEQWIFNENNAENKNGYFTALTDNENIIEEKISTSKFVKKQKFAKEFWPEFKWGRKGYLHTRWRINSRILDLINIHLFHDESNLELTQNPLLYSQNRQRALNFTIKQYNEWTSSQKDKALCHGNLFIFGDFNFRLRTDSFLRKITKDQEIHEIEDINKSASFPSQVSEFETNKPQNTLNGVMSHDTLKRNLSAIEFRPKENKKKLLDDSNIVLRIEKKRFDYVDAATFVTKWDQYRDDDTEPREFNLKEMQIKFPPTYPWSEDPLCSNCYMKTRAPAWCDRVLMNNEAFELVQKDSNSVYTCIGLNACMGDHKPVLLGFSLL